MNRITAGIRCTALGILQQVDDMEDVLRDAEVNSEFDHGTNLIGALEEAG